MAWGKKPDAAPAPQAEAPKVATPPVAVNVPPILAGVVIPKAIGRCADLLHDVRDLRLAMEKEAEQVKAFETAITEHIINNLSASDDTGAAGLKYRVQVKKETKPAATDWPAIWAYIKANDRFDLLQKRLGDKAVTDMWDAGEEIPGVGKVHVPKLSLTKV